MALDSIKWKGTSLQGRLLETVEATIEIDEYGVAKATEVYLTRWDGAVGLVLAKYQHTDYKWLLRKTATITREEADLARVEINFEGVPPEDQNFSFSGRDGAKYKLSGTTSTSPIETHPAFDDWAGLNGTELATANGVIYTTDKDGNVEFKGFALKDGDGNLNQYAGIKTYLEGGFQYEESRVKPSGQSIGSTLRLVGKIDTDVPASPVLPTTFDDDRNWLLIGADAELVGNGIRITRKWRLSGRRKFLSEIYGSGGGGGGG